MELYICAKIGIEDIILEGARSTSFVGGRSYLPEGDLVLCSSSLGLVRERERERDRDQRMSRRHSFHKTAPDIPTILHIQH